MISHFCDTEDDAWDKNYNKLCEISDKNKFKTVWSISEVSAEQIENKFPSNIKQLSYKGQSINFNKSKNVSWLDLWKVADQLILRSEDDHHIFIEDFDEDSGRPGYYEVSTGS